MAEQGTVKWFNDISKGVFWYSLQAVHPRLKANSTTGRGTGHLIVPANRIFVEEVNDVLRRNNLSDAGVHN
jgi:hypothetical protein